MSQDASCVIIGAGQAGSELAAALRQQGFEGRIVMVGEEPHLPYRRPPLSKTFLSGEVQRESLFIKQQSAYDKLNVECMLGVTATAIDRAAHTVTLSDGRVLPYTKLALATGGRPRVLPIPGGTAENVHYVRTIGDIERLQADFAPGKKLVIIGGGYIGLEAAAVGIKKGLSVTVIEAMPRVLARVTAPEISAFYQRIHGERGVELKIGAGVEALEGEPRIQTVVLSDGQRVPADLVIVGIGLIPNTELAEAAGLEVNNGIVVDAHAQTSDPDIVAAGDCSFHHNDFLGRSVRLESVPNAMEQARVAAAAICGKPVRYAAVPWFWSDQYDFKLQMVGLNQGYDDIVIRGDTDSNSFCAFYLREGVLVAADAVNQPKEFMMAKKLVAASIRPDPAVLADPAQELKGLLPAA